MHLLPTRETYSRAMGLRHPFYQAGFGGTGRLGPGAVPCAVVQSAVVQTAVPKP